MNLVGWNEIDLAALRSFYETGNQWSWEDLESGTTSAARAAREWIETSFPPRGHPLLLPRVQGLGISQRTNWYAIAFNETQAEELREHLSAFIGSAGTDFSGRRADLDPTDIAESALAAWAGGPWVYRFAVLSGNRDVVRNALQRLQQVWRLRPAIPTTAFRTTEALLREFSSALVNLNEAGAAGWLGELRAGGRLSAENLVFLEIERLATFGRWHDLVALPQVALLTLMRRPRHITALLIEALWRTEFTDFMVRGDADGAVKRFQSDFYPRHRNLLRTRGSLTSEPVALTFLLVAVTADPPRREQLTTLLELLKTTPHRSFVEKLVAFVPTDTTRKPESWHETPLQRARTAFQNDDFDTALLHLRKAPPSPEVCTLLLECASESQSVDDARIASNCFDLLTVQEQERILSSNRRRRAWEYIQELLIPTPKVFSPDWEGWLDRVDAHVGYAELLPLAQQSIVDWPLAQYSNNPQRVHQFAERLMADRNQEAQDILRLAHPHLLRYFLRDGKGDPAFLHLYRTILFILGISERFTSDDWITCQTLLLAVLDAGTDREVYTETIETLREVWTKFGSPLRFDWALDVLDLLIAYPAPAVESRDAFYYAIRDRLSKDYRRVGPEHWETFRWLANDLGRAYDYEAIRPHTTTADSLITTSFNSRLAGKLVAIYTLTESAGIRAKDVIEHLFKNVTVRLNHDCVGSDRLKALAREADYFLVVTRSAKHAATEFLKTERTAGKRHLIYPSGKGTSSIVSSLLSAIRAEV